MGEDWGVVSQADLFDRVGEMRPLADLIHEAAYGKPKKHGLTPAERHAKLNEDYSFVSDAPMDWWSRPYPTDKIVPTKYKPVPPTKRAPKILKKKADQPGPSNSRPKRVTFEIIQEARADELTRAQMKLVKKGAKPKKGKYVNYKVLKKQRAAQRIAEENDLAYQIFKPRRKKNNKKNNSDD